MKGINWYSFGLKANPFNNNPLHEGGEYMIDQVFVGREHERKILDSLFEFEEQGSIVVSGNVGVGKTSLVNLEKSLWKIKTDRRALFSFRREIEAKPEILDKKMFIFEIIASTLREINLLDHQLLKNDPTLQRLDAVVNFISKTFSTTSSDISGSLGVLSGSISQQEHFVQSAPMMVTMTFMEKSLDELLNVIKTIPINGVTYRGLIVHMNNFDVLFHDKKNKNLVIQFFQEIRDLLQTKDIFYIFLGPENFFNDIIRPYPRLKPVFYSQPIQLEPLSKEDVIKTLKERFDLLKSDNVSKIIYPFDDRIVEHLYDLYKGDVRSIFKALEQILRQTIDLYISPLTYEESLRYLSQELLEELKRILKPAQYHMFLEMLQFDKPFTMSQIEEVRGKKETNLSAYYFLPLQEAQVIEVVQTEGREKYWAITAAYLPVKQSRDIHYKRIGSSR